MSVFKSALRTPHVIFILFILILVPLLAWTSASEAPPHPPAPDLLQAVKEFQHRLEIPEPIRVQVVPHNPRLASSEPAGDGFLISVDRAFLATLDPREREAMLAHEMGHIWIFTHHPYLQTEALANRIAARVVSDKGLAGVYRKVSLHSSDRGR